MTMKMSLAESEKRQERGNPVNLFYYNCGRPLSNSALDRGKVVNG
jgi:hypothetical protein